MKVKYLILGAGPTGLASALRLSQLGITDFLVIEKESKVGGLCRTFKQGEFYFDNCTHILFTLSDRIKKLMKEIKCQMTGYDRSAWVHAYNKRIHFPLQTSVSEFPIEKRIEVIKDIAKRHYTLHNKAMPHNYGEYLRNTFGEVLYQDFFLPYNTKLWQTDLYDMSLSWMKGRVPPLDLDILLKSLFEPNTKWGVNSNLSYPNQRGFGEITDKLFESIPNNTERFKFNVTVTDIDSRNKFINLSDGSSIEYDTLITTIPLPLTLKMVGLDFHEAEYRHTKVVTTAIGFREEYRCPDDREHFQWCYFGDRSVPFYRLFNVSAVMEQPKHMYKTYLFDHNLPAGTYVSDQTKLNLFNSDVQHAIELGFMHKEDEILSWQSKESEYAYPVPTLERDEAMKRDHAKLESLKIYSRGRFGYWKYECGNTDHSILQGLEIIDRLVEGKKEETIYGVE